MNKIRCTITKLVDMLVTTEGTLKSLRGSVLIVEQTPFKRKSTRKKKTHEEVESVRKLGRQHV